VKPAIKSYFRRFSHCLLPTAYCLLALSLSGCNIGGALAYKFFGPTKEPAEYTPPKDRPLVVVVENYHNPADLQQPADQLAAMISDKLEVVKIAPIIPTEKVVALRTEKGAAFDKMKIPDIGRAVGARQVVYVNLKQCSIEHILGADDIRCNIDAFVKVVDVDTGATKWPDTGDGKEFPIHTDYNRSEGHRTEESVRDGVLDDLSTSIAVLFFAHQPDSELPKD
jgi:hypothetical protein